MAFLVFSTWISFVAVFPAAARAFFEQEMRSWDVGDSISCVEVFPAAAGVFLLTQNGVPRIL